MKVKLSRLASSKLENLLNHLESEWSVQSRNRFLKHFSKKLEILSSYPYLSPRSTLNPSVRKLVINRHCSIYYMVLRDEINIITLMDNRQNQRKVLKELKRKKE